jgi:hypothetical protein
VGGPCPTLEHPSAAWPRQTIEIGQAPVPEDEIQPICLNIPAPRLQSYSTQHPRSEIKEVVHSTWSDEHQKDG